MRATGPLRFLLCVLAALSAVTATAAPFHQVRVPALYKTWTFTYDSGAEATVSQSFVPLTLVRELGDRGHLVVSTTLASSNTDYTETAEPAFTNTGLTALSDVKVQGVYRLNEALLVQAGVNLPAGKTELSLDEFYVVRHVSHPLLGFPQRRYGQGWGASAGAVWARRVSPGVELGLGVGGILHGEYRLLAEVYEEYRPGYEAAVSGGLTTGGGDGARLRLDLTYRVFGEDTVEGETAYRQGNQVEAQVEYAPFSGSSWVADLTARAVLKSDAEISSGDDALEAVISAPGNSYSTGADVYRWLSRDSALGLAFAYRGYSGSETTRQDGTVLALGPAWLQSAGGGTFRLSIQYLWGALDANQAFPAADLSGWSVGLGFQWEKP